MQETARIEHQCVENIMSLIEDDQKFDIEKDESLNQAGESTSVESNRSPI